MGAGGDFLTRIGGGGGGADFFGGGGGGWGTATGAGGAFCGVQWGW